MIGLRRCLMEAASRLVPTRPLVLQQQTLAHRLYSSSTSDGTTSTSTPAKKKKKNKNMSISQVPISVIGVMSDHYIPPKLTSVSITRWPRVLLNRFLLFGFNTYNILKFKREINKPLQFNDWKDQAIETYVRTNKVFAQACNNFTTSPSSTIYKFITSKLDQSCGKHLNEVLTNRAVTFRQQPNIELSWDLVSIDKNPKVSVFTTIPDEDGIGVYVQFVMNLKTTQKLTISDKRDSGKIIQQTETKVNDYLVYTMNPWDGRILLVGKLFESDAYRGLKSELDVFDTKTMGDYLNEAADIYREDPRLFARSVEGSNKNVNKD